MGDIVSNLAGHWALNDNAASTAVVATVGSNGTLTNAGNTSASTVAGPGGTLTAGLSFDGTNDYVALTTGNNAMGQNRGTLTLAVWFKIASAPAANGRMVWLSTNASGTTTRAALSMTTTGTIRADARAGDAESTQSKETTPTYADNAWHHGAVVIDYANDTMTIYIDGTAVSQTGTPAFTATATSNTTSASVALGSTGSGNYLGCSLADARVYQRALVSGDIADLVALGNSSPPNITTNPNQSVIENNTAICTMASSTPVTTWSISGGADAALVTIDSSTGVLSFVNRPNYESPADADSNNVYEFDVDADSAAGNDSLSMSVTVTNRTEEAFEPADLAEFVWRYSARNIVGLNDGDPVSSWPVEGTGSAATASGGDRPTYDDGSGSLHGRPGVVFTSNRMVVPAFASSSVGEWWFVFKQSDFSTTPGIQWVANKVAGGNSASGGLRFDATTTLAWQTSFKLAATPTTARFCESIAPPCHQIHVHRVTYDGTTFNYYINGHLQDSNATSGAINTASGTMAIGNHDSASQPLVGTLYEIMEFNDVLASGDADDLLASLQAMYVNDWTIAPTNVLSVAGTLGGPFVMVNPTNSAQRLLFYYDSVLGGITYATASTSDPHNWTPIGSVILSGDFRSPAPVYDSGTWYMFYDNRTTGTINVASGAALGSLTPYGGNPIIPSASPNFYRHPSVIKDGATWKMWYDRRTDDDPTGRAGDIGYATSSSPTGTWTLTETVVDSGDYAWESTDAGSPAVRKTDGGAYEMLYAGFSDDIYDPLFPGTPHSIGYATSADGTAWTKAGEIIGYDYFGWAEQQTTDPAWDVHANGDLFIYMMAKDDAGLQTIGYASYIENGATSPPSITTGANHSVDEGETDVVTMAADGDGTFAWSIIGGADASLFAVDSVTGAVTFIEPPDYETPLDADEDNVYHVDVQVGSEFGADSLTLNVTVNDVYEHVTSGATSKGPWDLTVANQLSTVVGFRAGLDRPQAYPYLTEEGDVYALVNFQEAADFIGLSMLDWEPEVLGNYSTGTCEVVNGVVTITGGSLPNYGGNPVYPIRFYYDGGTEWYPVASYDSTTQVTLVDTTLDVPSGTDYKYASWDYRELDPAFTVNDEEWQQAHDEFAHALLQVEDDAIANGARVGFYEMGIQIWRRVSDIVDDLPTWQADAQLTRDYVTSSGFKILDWLKDRNGRYCWTNYVPNDSLANAGTKARWLERNLNIMTTLRDMDIPNVPLFRCETIEGDPVPEDFQLEMLQQVQAFQPFEWAVWGGADEITPEFIEFITEYVRGLFGGATVSPIQPAAMSAAFSPTQPPIVLIA